MFQSLFYWITYSYYLQDYREDHQRDVSILILLDYLFLQSQTVQKVYLVSNCFNPYFTGLPILINPEGVAKGLLAGFQSLFYWITYSYQIRDTFEVKFDISFNPYFTGLPILIMLNETIIKKDYVVSILILLDYLFLSIIKVVLMNY